MYKKTAERRPEIADKMTKNSKSIGIEKLLELIKNYSKNDEGNLMHVTIGIIGFPNVGKSSLINSLMHEKVASVSSIPG